MSVDRALLDREYPDEWHCVPDDDVREHEMSGACWCQPEQEVEQFEDGYFRFLWFHYAADNRHIYPDEQATLQ